MSILNLFNKAEQKVLEEVKVVENIFKKEESIFRVLISLISG